MAASEAVSALRYVGYVGVIALIYEKKGKNDRSMKYGDIRFPRDSQKCAIC